MLAPELLTIAPGNCGDVGEAVAKAFVFSTATMGAVVGTSGCRGGAGAAVTAPGAVGGAAA
jgi:hypothetical protein